MGEVRTKMSIVMEYSTTQASALPVLTRERPEDGSQDDRPGDVSENASPAFDAIVAALRSSDRTALLRRNAASPSQMFEVRNHNAHDARMQALAAHDRENRLSGQGTGETEPTGIAARRAARVSESAGHIVGDDRLKRGFETPRAAANLNSREARGDRVDEIAARRGREKMGGPSLDRLGLGGRPTTSGSSAVRTPHERSTPAVEPESPAMSGSMPSSAAPVFATVMQRGGAGSVSAAERVAEVLSTGRMGEADATRVASAVSSTPGSRQSFVRGDSAGQSEMGGKGAVDAKPTNETGDTRRSEFAELVRSVRLFSGPRRSTARIQLDPPELGRIRVDLRMADNKLEIRVLTTSAEAKAVLQERADLLRTALEYHGIHVEQFDIDTVSDGERMLDSPVGQGSDESFSSFAGMRRDPARSFVSAEQTRDG
ncbi:MAG: flagellar hook-length control protein FliK, partial [Planctomycetes bacterium]|nr:flagellar hook-length control protein FliK [Planctomycetota bacterium]